MTFPSTQELLDDPNVFIGDTAATVHMTPHKNGMTNLRKAMKEDAVTRGNKQVEKTTEIGDIHGESATSMLGIETTQEFSTSHAINLFSPGKSRTMASINLHDHMLFQHLKLQLI
jgi:methionine aminopeptidase